MADRICGLALRKTLFSRNLAFPDPATLLRLERILLKGLPANLARHLAGQSVKVPQSAIRALKARLCALSLEDYKYTKSSFGLAEGLLPQTHLRYALETLLMTKYPISDIVAVLKQRFSVTLTEAQVITYRHFFYDPRIMDGPSWTFYLTQLKDPHEAAIKLTTLRNPDYLTYLKWKAGFEVDIDYVDMLKRTLHNAFFRLEEEHSKAAPDDLKLAHYSMLMFRAGDRIEKFKRPDDAEDVHTLQARFKALELKDLFQGTTITAGSMPPVEDRRPALVVLPGGRRPEEKN